MTERSAASGSLAAANGHGTGGHGAAGHGTADHGTADHGTGGDVPAVSARLAVSGAAQMRMLGNRLARLLHAGDLVVLAGSLGAGKTTLVQGLGEGLAVRGPITSPTFVIARVHPSLRGGPDLVHADAYRLGSRVEVDDLDLDADLDHSVTVVEWGEGLVENLAAGHLRVTIDRPTPESLNGDPAPGDSGSDDQVRIVTVSGYGNHWDALAAKLSSVLAEPLR